MKFNTRQDLDMPIQDVFAVFADTDRWERVGLRKGADVQRLDADKGLVTGAEWSIKTQKRGKTRQLDISLTQLHAPALILFGFQSALFEGDLRVELIALSARKTRVGVVSEVKPRTLAARIMIQSLKLAKTRAQKSYDQRVAAVLRDMVQRGAKGG